MDVPNLFAAPHKNKPWNDSPPVKSNNQRLPMASFRGALRNETMAETTTLVGIYVGESSHSRDLAGAKWISSIHSRKIGHWADKLSNVGPAFV